MKHRVVIAGLICWLATAGSGYAAEAGLPGLWREFESGGWHTAAKVHAGASGGKRVSWFDQPGRAVFVEFELVRAIPKAVLFVRASRAFKGGSSIAVAIGPMKGDKPGKNLRALGDLKLPRTGGWNRYRWITTPVGDLAAGRYALVVRCTERHGAGDLDVAALVPDDAESRWMPPNEVKDGKIVGEGTLLDAPRPDDRMTEEERAAARAAEEQRQREQREAAAKRAHISDPANRLPITASWFGNDIATGPEIPAWGGQTPHNVADIHVAPDGTLFTNVHWEEHGANVTEFKGGKWINSAHVGNHGGGRSVAANSRYVYFIGNKHRTGKGGIDRRIRKDISKQDLNVHVDVKGIRAVAATENRVFAAAGEGVAVYDADLKLLSTWRLPGADKMAVDKQGHLWVILPAANKVGRFTQTGKCLPQEVVLDPAVQPTDVAIDARGRLLVADGGPSEQVLIYDHIDNAPKLADRFGEKGGVYSGLAGRLGPKRFVRLVGVGADDAGNIYTASRASNNGSTILHAYSPKGDLLWQKQCQIWLDCPDLDPDNRNVAYSSTARFRLDYDSPIGQMGRPDALTVHHRAFTDDFRHRAGGSGGTFLRRLNNGSLYQYLVDMLGKTVHVYRFAPEDHGEIAIPAGFVHQKGIWVDRNGDGRRDAADPAGMTYRITLGGKYEGDALALEMTVVDGNGHRRTLNHRLKPAPRGPRAGVGIFAGGERVYRFARFGLKTGTAAIDKQFGSAEGRDADGGFAPDADNWALEAGALRARGNRKGGKPRSFTAARQFDELTPGKDFEIAATVAAPRGRLYADRFGVHILGKAGDWRSGVGAVVNVNGGFAKMELRKGFGGSVIASRSLSDEVTRQEKLVTVGHGVDSQGAIWNATHVKGIYRYPIQGFTKHGVPLYTTESRERYETPAGMKDLRRVYHFPERGGLLLVNGGTAEHTTKGFHWKVGGPVIRCYENWKPATPTGKWKLRWELAPPYENRSGGNHGDGNIMSLDIAGDYLFVGRVGQSGFLNINRIHVDVYRLKDASYVGWMEPTENVGDVGILDITQAMKAFRRDNGEYVVFLEEGAKARTLVYRWKPEPR
jgi:hypothetical protein